MSYRNCRLLPFSPNAAFVVARRLCLDGVEFEAGQPVPEGLSERLLRKLYEQRRIAPVAAGAQQSVAPVGSQDATDPATTPPCPPSAPVAGETSGDPAPDGAVDPNVTEEASGAALPGAGAGDGATEAGDDAASSAAAAQTETEGAVENPAGPVVEKSGMGGWRVVAADGSQIGPNHKTKAAATAALADHLAKGA